MSAGTLIQHFDSLSDLADGPKKLRELGVALAVRGRLTRQTTSADAAEALDTAIAERDHALADHRGKRLKALPDIEQVTFPFALPPGWVKCWSGDLLSFVTSGSRGWAKYYSSEGPLFLRIGNLDYQAIRLDLSNIQRVTPPETAEGRRTRVLPGDILVSITGDTGMVGLIPDGFEEAYINQHIALARSASTVNSAFLAWYFTSPYALSQFWDFQRGIKNSLGLDDIRSIPVALPPPEEQVQIVESIERWYALCDELEAKQQKKRHARTRLNEACLDSLLTAQTPDDFAEHWQRILDNFDLLYDAPGTVPRLRSAIIELGCRGLLSRRLPEDGSADELLERLAEAGPGRRRRREVATKNAHWHEAPAHWCWLSLADIAEFRGGGTPSKRNPDYWDGDVPWVSPKDMKVDYVADAQDHITKRAVEATAVKLIPAGSLLAVTRGMILAHSFPVALTQRPVTINQDMKAVTPLVPDLAEYLLRYLWAAKRHVLAQVLRSTHGTCRLETSVLTELPVALPPLGEQARIVSAIDGYLRLCDEFEAALVRRESRGRELMAALVHASGRVDPEPRRKPEATAQMELAL